jgi:hypothetical protein
LEAVEGISFRAVGYVVGQAGVPENFTVRGIKRHQMLGTIARE